MKTKKFVSLLLTLCMLLSIVPAMGISASAESSTEYLTVNDGTDTNTYAPIYGYNADVVGTRTQFIQSGSALADLAGNTLSSLTFYSTSEKNYGGSFTVKLMEVTGVSLSSEFIDTTAAKTVYEGSINFTDNKAELSLIEDAFTYEGGDLLVEITVKSKASYGTLNFYGINNAGSYLARSGGSTYNNVGSFAPKVTFGYVADPDALRLSSAVSGLPESLASQGGATFTVGGIKKSRAHSGDSVVAVAKSVLGYTCTGFTSTPEVAFGADGSFTMPNSDITVTAIYTALPKLSGAAAGLPEELAASGGVTFSVNGNATEYASAGVTVTAVAKAVAGYTCTGFTSTPNVTFGADGSFTMPSGDITVTAIYTALPRYQITGSVSTVGYTSLPVSFTAGGDTVTECYEGATVSISVDGSGFTCSYSGTYGKTGTENELTINADGTFTMPAGKVNVAVALSPLSTITVNDGSKGSYYCPFYGYYVDAAGTCSQFIQPASTLTTLKGNAVSSITFYSSLSSFDWGGAEFTVKMMSVKDASLSNDFIDMTDAATVYVGPLPISDNAMSFNLIENSFTYTGDDLVVEITVTKKGSWKSNTFYGASGQSRYKYSWSGGTEDFAPKMTIQCSGGSGKFVSGDAAGLPGELASQGGVTFTVNDAVMIAAEPGDTVIATAKEVTGYSCTGFTSEQVATFGADGSFTMPDGDVLVTATYAAIPKLSGAATGLPEELAASGGVTFSVNGNATEYASAGVTVTAVAKAVDGYTCTGFTSTPEVTFGADGSFTMPSSDITVTAIYTTLTKYQITGSVSTVGYTSLPVSFTAGGDTVTECYVGAAVSISVDGSGFTCSYSGTYGETGTENELTINADGTFTMPAGKVKVAVALSPLSEIAVNYDENNITTSDYLPISTAYANKSGTRSQFIQPASTLSELKGSVISSITFYVYQKSASMDGTVFTVKMLNAKDVSLSESFIDMTNATTVYEGPLSVSGNVMAIELIENSFTYTGDDLVVEIAVSQTGSWANAAFFGTSGQGRYKYQDTENTSNFAPMMTIKGAGGSKKFVSGTSTGLPEELVSQGGVTFTVNGYEKNTATPGATVIATAKEVTGYSFTGFTSEQVATFDADGSFIMPDGDVLVTATYAEIADTVDLVGSDGKTIENEAAKATATAAISNINTGITSNKEANSSEEIKNVLGTSGYVDVKLVGVGFDTDAANADANSKITTYTFNVTPYTASGTKASIPLTEAVTFRMPLNNPHDFKYANVFHEGAFMEQVELTGKTFIEVTSKYYSDFSYQLTNTANISSATYNASLTLDADIDLNFTMGNLGTDGNGAGFDQSKLKITVDGTEWTGYTYKDGELSGVLKEVVPKDIGTDLHIVITYDGIVIKDFNYSVKAYCDAVFAAQTAAKQANANDTTYDKLAALCEALLNYGKYVADYVNKNTDSTLNENHVKDFSNYTISGVNAKVVNGTDGEANLSLGSTITLKYYVKTDEALTNTDSKTQNFFVLNGKGEQIDPKRVTITDNGNDNYLVSIDLYASQLATSYTLKLKGVSTDDFCITYGVYNYCEDAQKQESFSATLKTLCKAIHNYSVAVDAYIESTK